MSDIVRLGDIRTIPDLDINDNGQRQTTDSWLRVDLLADELRKPPQPPAIHGLLYAGKRHVLSGPPESAKTLIAYTLLLQALRQGDGVAIIDIEMGPYAAVTMLRELGATDHEIGQILYFEPQEQPYDDLAQHLTVHGVRYVLIDAGAGAYGISGLDDNKRQEVEQFANTWIRPLQAAGISTLVLEHVVKNADNRGGWMIGSERKLGQADVHLGLAAVVSLSRGNTGIYKVTVHKDRSGYLKRGHLLDIHLTSDPDTHRVSWELKPAEHHSPDDDGFRPTALMEKVSRWLEEQGGAHSGNQIEKSVEGKNDFIRRALKVLAVEGHVAKTETGKGFSYSHITSYRKSQDLAPEGGARYVNVEETQNATSPRTEPLNHAGLNLAPTSPHLAPGEVSPTSPLAPPFRKGGEVRGESEVGEENPEQERGEVDIYDPDIQHLLDDDQPDW